MYYSCLICIFYIFICALNCPFIDNEEWLFLGSFFPILSFLHLKYITITWYTLLFLWNKSASGIIIFVISDILRHLLVAIYSKLSKISSGPFWWVFLGVLSPFFISKMGYIHPRSSGESGMGSQTPKTLPQNMAQQIHPWSPAVFVRRHTLVAPGPQVI